MPTIGTSCFSPGRRTSPRPPGGFFVTRRTSSAYPSNTERERGVALRARRPACALMRAGKRLFEAFRRAGRFGLGPREQSGDIGEEDGGASSRARVPRPDARRHRRIQPRCPEGAAADARRGRAGSRGHDPRLPARSHAGGALLQTSQRRPFFQRALRSALSRRQRRHVGTTFPRRLSRREADFAADADPRLFTGVPFAFNLLDFNPSRLFRARPAKPGALSECARVLAPQPPPHDVRQRSRRRFPPHDTAPGARRDRRGKRRQAERFSDQGFRRRRPGGHRVRPKPRLRRPRERPEPCTPPVPVLSRVRSPERLKNPLSASRREGIFVFARRDGRRPGGDV